MQDIQGILEDKKGDDAIDLHTFNQYNKQYLEDTQYSDPQQKVQFDVKDALPTYNTKSYGDKNCKGIQDIIRIMRNKVCFRILSLF